MSCFTVNVCAETYAFDPGFGNNGVVSKDFGGGDDEIRDLVMQSDGKIVVVGFISNDEVKNMTIARYLSNGTIDSRFGNDPGYTTLSFGTRDSKKYATAMQDDGKILVVGSAFEDKTRIAIVRFTADGHLDSSFGDGGKMVITTLEGNATARDVAVSKEGEIYISGEMKRATGFKTSVIAKITAAGELNTEFGKDGIFVVEKTNDNGAHGIAILENGNIIISGYTMEDGSEQATMIQVTTNGDYYEDFADGGEFSLDNDNGIAEYFDVLLLGDRHIIGIGYLREGSESYREPLVTKLNADGSYDKQFGGDGVGHFNLGYDGVAQSVVEQSDGTLLLTGTVKNADGDEGHDLIILHVNTQGELSQVTANYWETNFADKNDEGFALASLTEGTVIAAGYIGNGIDNDFFLVQYALESTEESAAEESSASIPISESPTESDTGNYDIFTMPVTNITRNSAASGGKIDEHISSQDYQDACEKRCDESTSQTNCIDDCVPPTVVDRGVCYGIVAFPVYRADGEVLNSRSTEEDENSSTEDGSVFSNTYTKVRSGQTSDGTGIGNFGSDMYKITPDETYYVRAYAVLSDDDVIYGNQVSFKTNDACFIATAAFGSLLDDEVKVLRKVRDTYLKKFALGQKMIAMYYQYSPPVADVISRSELLLMITRACLLPVVGCCYVLLLAGPLMLLGSLGAFVFTSLFIVKWLKNRRKIMMLGN